MCEFLVILSFAVILFLPDGNGFKTSTMRLGADVIVFSRCSAKNGKRLAYWLHIFLPCILCLAFA